MLTNGHDGIMEGVVFTVAAIGEPGDTAEQYAVISESGQDVIDNRSGLVLGHRNCRLWPQNNIPVPVILSQSKVDDQLIPQEVRVPLDLLRDIALHGSKSDGFPVHFGPVDTVQ